MVSKEFLKHIEPLLFPIKLYKLAQSREIKSIQWSREGTAIKLDTELLRKECFANGIFNVADCKHVFRQLSYYNFHRIKRIGQVWEFCHPHFLATRFDLIQTIRRPGKKNKNNVILKSILPFIERRRSSRLQKKESERKAKLNFFEEDECRDDPDFGSDAKARKPRRGRKRKICDRDISATLSHSPDPNTAYNGRPLYIRGGKDLNLLKMCIRKDNLPIHTRSQKYATVGKQSRSDFGSKKRKRGRIPGKKSCVKTEKADPSHHATILQATQDEMEISNPGDHDSNNDSKTSVLTEVAKSSPKMNPTTCDNLNAIDAVQLNDAGKVETSEEKVKSSNPWGHYVLDKLYKWMPVDKINDKKSESESVKEQESNLNVDALPIRSTPSCSKQPEASSATTNELVCESQSTFVGISNGKQSSPHFAYNTKSAKKNRCNSNPIPLPPRSCKSRYFLRDRLTFKQAHFIKQEPIDHQDKKCRDKKKILNSNDERDHSSDTPVQSKSFLDKDHNQASSVSKSSYNTLPNPDGSNHIAVETDHNYSLTPSSSETSPINDMEIEEVDSFAMNYRKQLDPNIQVQRVRISPENRRYLTRVLYLKYEHNEIGLFDILDSPNPYIRGCAYDALTLNADIALRRPSK